MGGEAGHERRRDDGLTIYDAMGLEAAFKAAGIAEVAGAGNGGSGFRQSGVLIMRSRLRGLIARDARPDR